MNRSVKTQFSLHRLLLLSVWTGLTILFLYFGLLSNTGSKSAVQKHKTIQQISLFWAGVSSFLVFKMIHKLVQDEVQPEILVESNDKIIPPTDQVVQLLSSKNTSKHQAGLSLLQDLSSRNNDLAGLHLSGLDLTGIKLAGASLQGTDLSQADLSGVDLSGAILSNAVLNGANLDGANLSETDLSEANLSYASLCRANLGNAKLRQANLIGADCDEANLDGANLNGANLSETNLNAANLIGANLLDVNFYKTNLKEANLWKSFLDKESLSEALLCGTTMPNGTLETRDCLDDDGDR